MGSKVLCAKMVDMKLMGHMWQPQLDRRGHHHVTGQGQDGQLFSKEHSFADPDHFMEILSRSASWESHHASLAKLYEDHQNNAVSLLTQQLDTLNIERLEAERRRIQIMEENMYEVYTSKAESMLSIEGFQPNPYDGFLGGDDGPRSWSSVPGSENFSSDAEGDYPAEYWRDRARVYAKLLSESIRREELLSQKLSDYVSAPSTSQDPLEDLRQQLHHFDNFLRFTLRKAPVVIAHQDLELRYRFVYNAFPTLTEEEVIGKTDPEIYRGAGVAELMEFKREVLRKGYPEKREINFNTDLFGEKTFLVALEPVMNRAGEVMGLNYVAMDVSEQVDKRDRLARIREQVAVQKVMESELHKTIHITEETMRAKQMLATMSHEIRSPLSGVVSMAEILATTQLDAEQRQLVDVMVSSGDLVLQLINDILDLSKVQSGAMKFEAKKFRPREVVKHVLQMALASMQNKDLVLEARVYDDVPLEVIGDVLRIRQVFTNLVSNAIKFTHEGSVSLDVHVVASPPEEGTLRPKFVASFPQILRSSSVDLKEGIPQLITQQSAPAGSGAHTELKPSDIVVEDTVWLHCNISDTGIGIPEEALPMLFERYTQVSTEHARKYGGTGLGLAICKNLVELMGGLMTVTSQENEGSMFSFRIPLRVARERSLSTGQLSEEVYDMMTNEAKREGVKENLASTKKVGYIHFTSKVTTNTAGKSLSKLNSQCSSSLMATSLTCSTSESSSSEPHTSKRPMPHPSAKSGNLQKSANNTSGNVQNALPEFTAVDSKVPDSRGYVPGLSMPQCESPGSLVLKNVLGGSDPRVMSNSRSPRSLNLLKDLGVNQKGSIPRPLRGAGPSKGSGESPEIGPPIMGPQRPTRILLAEDNKVNVMVAQSMLKRLGHDLEVVSNGAEALKALQRRSYDLILMDVCMPVMDGLEATRRIRRFEKIGLWEEVREEVVTEHNEEASIADVPLDVRDPNSIQRRTPIIAMTANALADNMVECYTHGMDSFIAKPVTFTKLEQVLKPFLPSLNRLESLSLQPNGVEDPKL